MGKRAPAAIAHGGFDSGCNRAIQRAAAAIPVGVGIRRAIGAGSLLLAIRVTAPGHFSATRVSSSIAALVADQEQHRRARRKIARVGSLHHVFLHAEQGQVVHIVGALGGIAPCLGRYHGERDRLLRVHINVQAP